MYFPTGQYISGTGWIGKKNSISCHQDSRGLTMKILVSNTNRK